MTLRILPASRKTLSSFQHSQTCHHHSAYLVISIILSMSVSQKVQNSRVTSDSPGANAALLLRYDVSPPENIHGHSARTGKFLSLADGCRGNLPKSRSPCPHSPSLSLVHKYHTLVVTLQSEAALQKPKSKLSTFRGFPESWWWWWWFFTLFWGPTIQLPNTFTHGGLLLLMKTQT